MTAPFSDLLPSGWHLTHLILLDPEWQANITDGVHVAVGTGQDPQDAIYAANCNVEAGLFVGKLFHLPKGVELVSTTPLLASLGLVERPLLRRKVT